MQSASHSVHQFPPESPSSVYPPVRQLCMLLILIQSYQIVQVLYFLPQLILLGIPWKVQRMQVLNTKQVICHNSNTLDFISIIFIMLVILTLNTLTASLCGQLFFNTQDRNGVRDCCRKRKSCDSVGSVPKLSIVLSFNDSDSE